MIRIPREVEIGALALKGLLGAPEKASALVIFAHGSGSGRLSPRNSYVAEALRRSGLATLLLDLLTPEEEIRRSNVFDIPLLATAAPAGDRLGAGAGGDRAAAHRLFWRKHGGGRGARGRSGRSPHLRGRLTRRAT